MYPNLNAEIARRGITRKAMAKKLGVSPSTLSIKLSGKGFVTLKEALAIKQILNVSVPMETLFASDKPDLQEIGKKEAAV